MLALIYPWSYSGMGNTWRKWRLMVLMNDMAWVSLKIALFFLPGYVVLAAIYNVHNAVSSIFVELVFPSVFFVSPKSKHPTRKRRRVYHQIWLEEIVELCNNQFLANNGNDSRWLPKTMRYAIFWAKRYKWHFCGLYSCYGVHTPHTRNGIYRNIQPIEDCHYFLHRKTV